MSGRIRYARFPLCLLPAFAVLAFVSCDGGDGGTPTSASSTPTALSISPATDFLKVGQTESFSAEARMSNGSTQTVTATWGSDAPGVAAVESGGLLRFEWQAAEGRSYRVAGSGDLLNWSPLNDWQRAVSGPVSQTINAPTNAPAQFFRLEVRP